MNIKNLKCFHVTKTINHSIEVMDTFTDDRDAYDVMILHNWFRTFRKSGEFDLSVSLCVFKSSSGAKICKNDITMTRLRELKGHSINLALYKEEVPFGIFPSVTQTVRKYQEETHDEYELIPLEYAIKLRAQTSWNRIGYGWEWDWSGGVGDYTEGTFYGETTDFYITHIIIKRVSRIKTWEEIQNEKIRSYETQIENTLKRIQLTWEEYALMGKTINHKAYGKGSVVAVNPTKDGVNIKVHFVSGKVSMLGLKISIANNLIVFEDTMFQEESSTLCKRIEMLAGLREELNKWKGAKGEALYDLIMREEKC